MMAHAAMYRCVFLKQTGLILLAEAHTFDDRAGYAARSELLVTRRCSVDLQLQNKVYASELYQYRRRTLVEVTD